MTEENSQSVQQSPVDASGGPVSANEVRFEGPAEAQGALVAAIAAASLEFEPIFKDATGQFERRTIKYAPLRSLVDATKPALAKHGVAVMQFLTGPTETNLYRLHAWVMGHGAIIKSAIDFRQAGRERDGSEGRYTDLSGSDVVKAWGARGTYLRRYQYQALFQLDGDDDLDQHGRGDEPEQQQPATKNGRQQRASRQQPPQRPAAASKPESKPESPPSDSVEGDLTELKLSITNLAKSIGIEGLEPLKGYSEKVAKVPWEKIRNSRLALMAVEHALKIDVESAQRKADAQFGQPAQGSSAAKDEGDERPTLLEECHALGAQLGMRTNGHGKVAMADMGRYAFVKFDAILDDMKRDPKLLRQLRDSLQADIEAGKRWPL